MTYSAKSGKVIDLEKALMYSLLPIPLSISNVDGTRRVTSKSKLLQCIKPLRNETVLPPKNTITDYIIDPMALICTLKDIPRTFEELIWKIVIISPSGYRSMHIIADTYRETSIKSSEREKRGTSSKFFIKSVSTMVPRKFHEFLQSDCNKTRLIELLFEYLQLNKEKVQQTLRSDNLVLSSDNSCVVVSRVAVMMEDLNLSSNHEEADTKIILHCETVLHRNHGENVCLWSPSGDTDITVLPVELLQELNDRVFIVSGSGSNTEHYKLSYFEIDIESTSALLGLHAFTGNNYVSSFFWKGKEKCWKVMRKS